MQVSETFPPNYEDIKKVFPVEEKTNVVFTYGDTLHNPHKVFVSADLDVHERTHALRQKEIGVDVWWDKYLTDIDFRFNEELIAYSMQYRFCKENMTAKNAKKNLEHFAKSLSSDLYGNLIDYQKAFTKIRKSV